LDIDSVGFAAVALTFIGVVVVFLAVVVGPGAVIAPAVISVPVVVIWVRFPGIESVFFEVL